MARLVGQAPDRDSPRIAMVERRRVLPPFTKRVLEIADCRPAHLELDVMPWGPCTVAAVECDRLAIAGMSGVVVASVTQIDTSLERDVFVRSDVVSNDDQLLVMAAAAPHSFVEDDLSSGLVDRFGHGRVFLLSEMGLARVRPPEQPADLHATSSDVSEDSTDLGAWSGEEFVAVALPIREEHAIVMLERQQCLVQTTEICGAVDEHFDSVTRRPCSAVTTPMVDRCRRVSTLVRRQEPIIQNQ
jgi:hypothetical protein